MRYIFPDASQRNDPNGVVDAAELLGQFEEVTKRIAELQEALEAAQRTVRRQSAFFRVEPRKSSTPSGMDANADIPGAFGHKSDDVRERYAPLRTRREDNRTY